jgi:hypothetical protein
MHIITVLFAENILAVGDHAEFIIKFLNHNLFNNHFFILLD